MVLSASYIKLNLKWQSKICNPMEHDIKWSHVGDDLLILKAKYFRNNWMDFLQIWYNQVYTGLKQIWPQMEDDLKVHNIHQKDRSEISQLPMLLI